MTPVDAQARALLERWSATPSVPVARLTATAVRQEDLMVLESQATPDGLHAVDDIEVPHFKQLFDTGAAYPKLLHRQPSDDRATGPADSLF